MWLFPPQFIFTCCLDGLNNLIRCQELTKENDQHEPLQIQQFNVKITQTHLKNYNKEYQYVNSVFLVKYHNLLNKRLSQQEFYH